MKHRTRVFSCKSAQHITLKATQAFFFNEHSRRRVDVVLKKYANRFHIRIYHRAIAQNHLHLVVLAKSASELSHFLRAVSGVIAQRFTGSFKGKKKSFKFWANRPWSRLVNWGRDFRGVVNYVALNYLESIRAIPSRNLLKNGAMVAVNIRRLIERAIQSGVTGLEM